MKLHELHEEKTLARVVGSCCSEGRGLPHRPTEVIRRHV